MKWILCCLVLLPLRLFGQQEVIGKIVDHYNKVIDYALVVNIQTGEHTHSDQKGQFVLDKNNLGDTIEISHLAFNNLLIVLDEQHFKTEQIIQMRDKDFDLSEIIVHNDVQNLNVITTIGLETNPVNSSQELLRQIPGLFIGQHAGGGKAEQIFLRGFDIDHGTDIRIGVDGIPVNMVSHAHGQGYADLHFLIPETVEHIDFGKGPYYTQQGNFATAGYVNFQTKDQLDYSVVGIEYGRFNTLRIKGLFNLLDKVPNHHAYLAADYQLSDGPFNSPQNFNRVNVFGKYTTTLPKGDRFSAQVGYFYSRWDASGQIPQRAVDAQWIDRFGAIDDTEGGQTSRANVQVSYTKNLSDHSRIKSRFFYSNYNFELYSNFTFFLNDTLNGDQIKQLESRNLFGGQVEINHLWHWKKSELFVKGGIDFRQDNSNNNELSHTKNRKTLLQALKLGNIIETNLSGWADARLTTGKWVLNLGLRVDYFKFNYVDLLDSIYNNLTANKVVASPKLNLLYSPHAKWQLYLKTGMGFHSNDTRVVVYHQTEQVLPAAYGADLGTIWKPFPKLMLDLALWGLYSEQEMVYVGDEAIVEPSGHSYRLGVDFGFHLQFWDWLFVDAGINYAYARSLTAKEGENFIPLAPDLTSSGGVSIKHPVGFTGGIRYRYLKNRPANEDNSIVAKGYFIVDLNAAYQYKRLKFGLVVENLFNSAWNEAQFATESRLRDETSSVEEIHFTPGMPFFIKGVVEYRF